MNLANSDALRSELQYCSTALEQDRSAENLVALANRLALLDNDSVNREMALLYTEAAEMGYAPAQTSLGTCYRTGWGVGKDMEKAFDWYKKAAEQGDTFAQYRLSECFEKDYQQFVFIWAKKSAEQGDPAGLHKLGECYEHGWGTPVDEAKAKKLFGEAHEKGYSRASVRTSNDPISEDT